MRGLYQKRLRDFTELEKEKIWSRPLVERLKMDNVFDTRNDESSITIHRADPEENWPQESPQGRASFTLGTNRHSNVKWQSKVPKFVNK